MKRLAILSALAFVCLPHLSVAQDAGCYERVYSADHLAANPDQGVSVIRVLFYPHETWDASVAVAALMADQGQGRRDGVGGQWLQQWATCGIYETGACHVDCDGGSLQILQQSAGSLLISTRGFRMGDLEGCGGQSVLAEPGGGETRYLLNAAPAATCTGLEF